MKCVKKKLYRKEWKKIVPFVATALTSIVATSAYAQDGNEGINEVNSCCAEAAKTLFTKKVKLIKLTVRAGYKVLLRDSHSQ